MRTQRLKDIIGLSYTGFKGTGKGLKYNTREEIPGTMFPYFHGMGQETQNNCIVKNVKNEL
ncbi:hypothetical protein Glove_248g4 [Diversispora epigaea]|uniref:Uncharacterized protein n=1 Tax=Diversispora epigaea TaxID=1348612 RepID=A0A397IDY8_9GLOM|nr:hypothetical protein Glove_248g4 [Diversispora epigaea]